jgi:hypothetical protein
VKVSDSPSSGFVSLGPQQKALPPADAVTPLLKEVLEGLAQGVKGLSRRHEVLHGGQFVVTLNEEDSDGDYQAPGRVSR